MIVFRLWLQAFIYIKKIIKQSLDKILTVIKLLWKKVLYFLAYKSRVKNQNIPLKIAMDL